MISQSKHVTIFVVAVGVLLVLLAGCMARRTVEKQTFVLDVSRNGAVSSTGTDAVLRVRTLRVSPRYEGKSFVYQTDDLTYESDYYNQFFAPPDIMITEEVLEWLEGSGLFRQVMDFTGQGEDTHILEGEVINLYGGFSRGTQPKAVLNIRFSFVQDISGRSENLFQKHYRRELPLKVDSAKALVEGWNTALARILGDLEEDLRALDLKTGP
jgi:uncharacterized lipoprotein YmbA